MQQLYNGVYSVPLYTYLLTKKSEQWCLNPFEVFLKIFLVCTREILKKIKNKKINIGKSFVLFNRKN